MYIPSMIKNAQIRENVSRRIVYSEFYDGQGLGNQLWTYAIVRSLAQKFHCDFSLLSSSRFKGKGFIDLDFGEFGNISLGTAPSRSTLFDSDTVFFEKKRKHRKLKFDMTIVNSFPSKFISGLKLEGNFENETYISACVDDIRAWYEVPYHYAYPTQENICIINLRGRDFSFHKQLALGVDYFINAMRMVSENAVTEIEFKVVTDDNELAKAILPNLEILSSSADFSVNYPYKKVAADLATLQNARYLILSNSSFSWWGAWTNKKSKIIIAPKFWARHNINTGFWSPSGIITDYWHYVDVSGKAWSSQECKNEVNEMHSRIKHRIFSKNWSNWWHVD